MEPDVIIVGAGQSGLAAAAACRHARLTPMVLEAGPAAVGSWPYYYDSLTLFSPARYSSLPGMPFSGDPDRYPHRDEVVAYLGRYAQRLDAEIRTNTRVTLVTATDGGFAVHTEDGSVSATRRVIAATGSFSTPHLPALPGLETFTGQVLHAAGYTGPDEYAGRRIVVVGAGNSAVQIAYELAKTATVTMATRAPVRFIEQRPLGRDLHFWFALTGFDRFPARLVRTPPTQPVLDTGIYRQALREGLLDRRPMFTGFDDDHVEWAGGQREQVDTVIFATGYRPSLDFLRPLGALDSHGHPRHAGGVSTSHAGLGYLGLEWQRTPASNSLRGVGRDAAHLIRKLAAHRR